jgi:hypothetical protein
MINGHRKDLSKSIVLNQKMRSQRDFIAQQSDFRELNAHVPNISTEKADSPNKVLNSNVGLSPGRQYLVPPREPKKAPRFAAIDPLFIHCDCFLKTSRLSLRNGRIAFLGLFRTAENIISTE